MQAAANDLGRLSPWTGSVGFLLSAALHVAVFVALGSFRFEPQATREVAVEISVLEEPPPPPPPPAPVTPPPPEPEAPEPEPVKPPPRVRERAPKPVETPPEQPPTSAPAPAQETIADFSGTTLTGEGQGGWLSAVGNGGAMNAPVGRPQATVTGRNREGVTAGGVIGGTGLRLVGEADLSRRPTLPSKDLLNRALERNYPKLARQQGIEGSARIKLRVLANGKLEPVRKDSESYPGFGDACMNALREVAQEGHRAQPPLDRQGQPAATEIRFNCTFSVE